MALHFLNRVFVSFGALFGRDERPVSIGVRSDCIGRLDGYYPIGCTTEYVLCAGGVAYSNYCPKGEVFHTEQGFCVDFLDHPDCRPDQKEKKKMEVQHHVRNRCTGLTPGLYADGCSSTYFECTKSLDVNWHFCASLSHRFDPITRSCTVAYHVGECLGLDGSRCYALDSFN